jgi:chromosomal replication initiation ATPase DnaA
MKIFLNHNNYLNNLSDYSFDNFIAIDSNKESKQIAMNFASNKTIFNTLVISSTIGNGATHLACAIMNEVNRNELNNHECLFVSFETLVRHVVKNGELQKDYLNKHYIVTIDSYHNWNNKLSKYLISTLKNLKIKIIITCSEFTDVPVEHFRINLSNPSYSDRKIIIKKLLLKEDDIYTNEVIDYISELEEFTNVRQVQAFILTLQANEIYNLKMNELKDVKKVFNKFKALI